MKHREAFYPPGHQLGEIVTEQLIDQVRTQRGGWTREILAWLGVSWPPENGWKERIIGRPRSPIGFIPPLPLGTPVIKFHKVKPKNKFKPFHLSHEDSERSRKRVMYVNGVENIDQAVAKAADIDGRDYRSAEVQKVPGGDYWMVALTYDPTDESCAEAHLDLIGLR